MLILLFVESSQSFGNLYGSLSSLHELLLSLASHVLEATHHLDLLLQCGHLDFDFDGLFLQLGVVKRLGCYHMGFELADLVLQGLVFFEFFDLQLSSIFILRLDGLDSFLKLLDDFLPLVLLFLLNLLSSFQLVFVLGSESTMQIFDHLSLLDSLFLFALTMS